MSLTEVPLHCVHAWLQGFEAAPAALLVADVRGTFVAANKAARAMAKEAGVEGSVVGREVNSVLRVKGAGIISVPLWTAVEQETGAMATPFETTVAWLRSDRAGSNVDLLEASTSSAGEKDKELLANLAVTKIKGADPQYAFALGLPISSAGLATAPRQEDLQTVLDAVPNAVVLVDRSGRIQALNEHVETLFGYSKSEMLGQLMEMLIPERYRHHHVGLRTGYATDPTARPMGVGRELFARRKDGREIPVEIGLSPLRTATGVMTLGSVVDLTERRFMERRFRQLVEAAPSGLLLVNSEGDIMQVNGQAEQIFGYSREELVGFKIEVLVPERSRTGHGARRTSYTHHPTTRPMGAGRDLFGRRRDGSEVPIEVALTPLPTDGSLPLTLVTVVDITERKKREAAQQKAELARHERERTLLAAISHEIRTPLMGLMGSVEMAALALHDGADGLGTVTDEIGHVRQAADTMMTVVNDIFEFAKLEAREVTLEQAPFQPRVMIDHVTSAMQRLAAAKKLAWEVEIAESVPPVLQADESRVRQVILHLARNAIKFTKRGAVTVVMSFTADPQHQGNGKLSVTMRDTGVGMGEDLVARLFTPFMAERAVTTRQYGGVGLGLAICKRLVELMGGSISATSEIGMGSDVTFILPVMSPTQHAGGGGRMDDGWSSLWLSKPSSDPTANASVSSNNNSSGGSAPGGVSAGSAPVSQSTTPTGLTPRGGTGDAQKVVVATDVPPARHAHVRRMSDSSFIPSALQHPATSPTPATVVQPGGPFVSHNAATNTGAPVGRVNIPLSGSGGHLPSMQGQPATKPSGGLPPRAPSASDLHGTAPSTTAAAPVSGDSANNSRRILVVEDDLVGQRVVSQFLRKTGYEVFTANNGRQAMTLLENTQVDLILMDCEMPVMDGFGATAEVRARNLSARHSGGRLPIIAMTANTMAGDRERCLRSGMSDYIGKPFHLQELAVCVQSWMVGLSVGSMSPRESPPTSVGAPASMIGAALATTPPPSGPGAGRSVSAGASPSITERMYPTGVAFGGVASSGAGASGSVAVERAAGATGVAMHAPATGERPPLPPPHSGASGGASGVPLGSSPERNSLA